jgi:hypothetical protein
MNKYIEDSRLLPEELAIVRKNLEQGLTGEVLSQMSALSKIYGPRTESQRKVQLAQEDLAHRKKIKQNLLDRIKEVTGKPVNIDKKVEEPLYDEVIKEEMISKGPKHPLQVEMENELDEIINKNVEPQSSGTYEQKLREILENAEKMEPKLEAPEIIETGVEDVGVEDVNVEPTEHVEKEKKVANQITLDEAENVAEKIISYDPKKFHIVGSIAYRKPFVNDIDLVTTIPLKSIRYHLPSYLESEGIHILPKDTKKKDKTGDREYFFRIEHEGSEIKVNIWFAKQTKDHDELPFMLLARSYPKQFEKALREKAKSLGYKLNEKGLYHIKGEDKGKAVATFTSKNIKDIFKEFDKRGFDIPYRTPEEEYHKHPEAGGALRPYGQLRAVYNDGLTIGSGLKKGMDYRRKDLPPIPSSPYWANNYIGMEGRHRER